MVILGLGSNIGNRWEYLAAAVHALAPVISNIQVSRIFESEAVLPPDATPDMNLPFLNMAISGNCQLTPQALLQHLKTMEQRLGRVARRHWGPREIDLDILGWDDLVLETEVLTVPHKELLNRDFALVPLGDVAPEWEYPVAGPYYRNRPAEIIQKKGYGPCNTLRETKLRIHV